MCGGRKVYENLVLSAQFCYDPKTALKNKLYLKISNHTHLSIPNPPSTVKFQEFMTY